MHKVKYWKLIKSNLSFTDAMNVLETRMIDNKKYERVSICLHGRIIDQYDDFRNLKFDYREATSNSWVACIPDSDEENLLYKIRELVKNEHFLDITHDKIDNLDIREIWKEIDKKFFYSDNKILYRLIKHIIDNKLYKKS